MFDLIKEFPTQLLNAIEIGGKATFNTNFSSGIRNVVVCGMGGSGIGGNMLAELLRNDVKVPVIVNKSYSLPGFVDSTSLVILSSYSGNTEETLSCAEQALAKGLKPVCVTSGGKLEQIAKTNNLDLITIPAGFPPRACLGYSGVQLFFILKNFGLAGGEFVSAYQNAAAFLQARQSAIMQEAEALAEKLLGKVVIVYADDKYESTALRLKQQINENAKGKSWYNVFPEMNHNELVGWREANEALAIIVLRADDEFKRNTYRIRFSEEVMKGISKDVYEITAKGADTFEKHFYLVHFGDWLSYYMAIKAGYDAMEIDVLLKLKDHMGGIK